jgi:serine/threonine protein kinase
MRIIDSVPVNYPYSRFIRLSYRIMRLQRHSTQQAIALGTELGGGGEGKIYAVAGDPSLVAKIYHPAKLTRSHGEKLAAMLANPPEDPGVGERVSIAWPVDLLRDRDGRTVGFLMQRVRHRHPLHEIYAPKPRRQKLPFFTWLSLHRTARNLAAAVRAVHARGYVIGDTNESNILVSNDALVTLVDTDSFQVRDRQQGTVYRCPVGKPEYTPPELQGRAFSQIDRAPEHDRFGLAVLIFQLLMEGTHPFDGRFQGRGEPPSREERISSGYFPHGTRRGPYRPKPFAPPFYILHPQIRQLFVDCFEGGYDEPTRRPDARAWMQALDAAEASLATCSLNSQHRYSDRLPTCPWCDRARQLRGRDPFPSPRTARKSFASPPPRRTAATVPNPPSAPRLTRDRAIVAAAVVTLGILGGIGFHYWQVDRQMETALDRTRTLASESAYDSCIAQAENIPPNSRFYLRAARIGDRCRLGRAKQLAAADDYVRAMVEANQVVPDTDVYAEAQLYIDRWSQQVLKVARQTYQSGELEGAIALLEKIPPTTQAAMVARETIPRWQQEWKTNQGHLDAANRAIARGRWQVAKNHARRVTTTYWKQQAREVLDVAHLEVAREAIARGDWGQAKQEAERVQQYAQQKQRILQRANGELDDLRLEAAREALYQGEFELAKRKARQTVTRDRAEAAGKIIERANRYASLKALLAQGQWEAANTETWRTLMLSSGRFNIPCEDIRIIDKLWTKFSNGTYGFSVQLRRSRANLPFDFGADARSLPSETATAIYPSRPEWDSYNLELNARLKACLR